MKNKKRYGIKNILITSLWVVIGMGTVVLLVAAIRKKEAEHCKGVKIEVTGVNNNFFVDKTDILNSITSIARGNPVGKNIGLFNLVMMEKELCQNIWVKSARLFFDNNEILQVKVNEREPLARVFTSSGNTFYIDAAISILPLSEKFSARLPVFTHFPSDKMLLLKEDSNLLQDIKRISLAIQKDSFLMAMIDQVDITSQRNFEMIPKLGNQLIVFGNASDIEEKFNKLQLFYKEVMGKTGWNNYSVINLQYKNQVIAKRKGADDIREDSLRTLQLMQLIAVNAEKRSGDSLQTMQQDNDHNTADSIMIQQSMQREDNPGPANNISSNVIEKNQVSNQPVLNSTYPTVDKSIFKQNPMPVLIPGPFLPGKKKEIIKKPKAIMHKRNDY